MKKKLGGLREGVRGLNWFFCKSFPGIFTAIRSKAVVESLEESGNYDDYKHLPFYKDAIGIVEEIERQGEFPFDKLFKGISKNVEEVQKIRNRLGLSGKFFGGFNFGKAFSETLQKINREKKQVKELSLLEDLKKVEPIVEPIDEKREDVVPKVASDTPPLTEYEMKQGKEKETECEKVEEEKPFFSSPREEHEFYQQRKKESKDSSSSSPKKKEELTEYKVGLFNFLLNRVFHPTEKQTWNDLVDDLAKLGFEGRPNKAGNGSTWVFSVTQRNQLFFHDENYYGATFNVHKPQGNEPLSRAYLDFFQSGFDNVFGLTEEYLIEALGSKWDEK